MKIDVDVFYFIMALTFLVGAVTQGMIMTARMDEAKRHRETDLKNAETEIKRLRAQVALHIGTK